MYVTNKCDSCTLKKICKHYKYFKDNDDITVDIESCENYKSNITLGVNNHTTVTHPVPMPTQIKEPNRVTSTDPGHIFRKDSSSPYKPLTATYATSSISAMPVTISKSTCSRCQQEVNSIDIDNCIECGRPICIDCGVTSISTTTGLPETTCEKCWSGSPDPDPNNPEDVTIVYGTEDKEEWDIEDLVQDTVEEKEKVDESKSESKQVDNKRPAKKSKK